MFYAGLYITIYIIHFSLWNIRVQNFGFRNNSYSKNEQSFEKRFNLEKAEDINELLHFIDSGELSNIKLESDEEDGKLVSENILNLNPAIQID